jgi:hypothetical protein
MDFDGLIDLSKESYDFHIKVAYANLKKLQFVTDSISNFKVMLSYKLQETLDNLQGNIYIKETLYQNTKIPIPLMILILIQVLIAIEYGQ